MLKTEVYAIFFFFMLILLGKFTPLVHIENIGAIGKT